MTTVRHAHAAVALQAGPIPLYYQLERHLAHRIRAGEFRSGAALPPEARLCLEYGVSRITVRRALETLLHDRLIARRRGVGTFVAEGGASAPVQLWGSLDDVLAYASDVTYRVLGRHRLRPPASVSERLHLAPAARVVRLDVVHHSRRAAFAHTRLFFPDTLGARIRPSDVTDGVPLVRLLEEKFAERVDRAEQSLEAAVASPELARQLRLAVNAPVLKVVRTYYTPADQPLAMAIVQYHSSYRYTVQLFTRRSP